MATGTRTVRVILNAAGLFNLTAAVVLAFGYVPLMRAVGGAPVPSDSLFLHIFAGAAALFGIGYLRAARDLAHRLVIELGVLGKLGIVALALGYAAAGIATWHIPALVSVDLVFAGLLFACLRSGHIRS